MIYEESRYSTHRPAHIYAKATVTTHYRGADGGRGNSHGAISQFLADHLKTENVTPEPAQRDAGGVQTQITAVLRIVLTQGLDRPRPDATRRVR